jgi:large subunit ribosomal protein L22
MAQIETKKTTTTKITVAKKPVVAKKPLEKLVESTRVDETRLGRARYINKNLKVSPRKLRLVANAVKKIAPSEAVTRLKFTNSNAARLMGKCIEDAIASATHNSHLLSPTLKFSAIQVDEGLKIKRMDKSHGSRFARGLIQRRHSRLTIILSGTIQS